MATLNNIDNWSWIFKGLKINILNTKKSLMLSSWVVEKTFIKTINNSKIDFSLNSIWSNINILFVFHYDNRIKKVI